MSGAPNLRCDNCGQEMWVGQVRSTIEVSVLWFCPCCHHEMTRLDPLGALEAELGGSLRRTFTEFLEQSGGAVDE
jgi:hypothetical protein